MVNLVYNNTKYILKHNQTMLEVQKVSNERSKLRKAEFPLVSLKTVNYLNLQLNLNRFFYWCRLHLIINNL